MQTTHLVVQRTRGPAPFGARIRRRLRAVARQALASVVLAGFSVFAADAPLLGWETLARPDRLAEFKPAVEVGSVSSYDRTGGNDDGFSGKNSFVRKEADGLVIADLPGPGVIYRLWTPTPTDDWMEFYFDGEAQPRIRVRFRDLFLGRAEPFVKPLVGYGVGGFFSYVPLPFAKSCKVLVRASRVQFYQINFARYAPGTPVQTYAATADPVTASQEAKAKELFGLSGQDITRFTAPPGSRVETARKRVTIPGGQSAVLFEHKKAGRIVGLRLSPADALAGKARDLVLRISFDGAAPAVLCPVGDFFGFAWGESAMRSLLVGATSREAYCYFPMPFDRAAKIELVSEKPVAESVDVTAEVAFTAAPRRANEGRFGAVWRRENPTQIGQPFTFLDTKGRGHLVGFVLQAQGMTSRPTAANATSLRSDELSFQILKPPSIRTTNQAKLPVTNDLRPIRSQARMSVAGQGCRAPVDNLRSSGFDIRDRTVLSQCNSAVNIASHFAVSCASMLTGLGRSRRA